MTDKALIELGYRYGVEVRDLARNALDALNSGDPDACRLGLIELIMNVDTYHRTLFASGPMQEGNARASGPMQEGNARASALDAQGALYGVLADNADALLRLEEERQRQMFGDGVQ